MSSCRIRDIPGDGGGGCIEGVPGGVSKEAFDDLERSFFPKKANTTV